MSKILLVENSHTFAKAIKNKIEAELGFEIKQVSTLAESVELIESEGGDFLTAIACYNLPDAPDGEIIDFLLSKNVPTIVFTGILSEKLSKELESKKIVDYVLKETGQSIEYIVSLLRRIHKNQDIKILVVDDSSSTRSHICRLLKIRNYQFLEAGNGEEALQVLEKNPDIKMVITDYNMPKMDGLRLTATIRGKHPKEKIAIIGLSALGKDTVSARFIKNGANDFMGKPFLKEEFFCRVMQNIDLLDHFEAIKQSKVEAEKANELKDKFVSLVAHDLRSPFTTILGFLQLIMEDEENPLHEEHREMMDMVVGKGKQLVELTEELLDVSRLKTGKISPKQMFIDGHQMVLEVIVNTEHLAKKKRIRLVSEVPKRTRLYVDQDLVGQVLQNLTTNAIKFCNEEDQITFFVPPGEATTIGVKDTGMGISESRQEILFQYEEQTSTTGTSGETGTGLGLPLSRDMMVAHGGDLTVESADGEGSTFYAKIPQVKPRVLIVDDSKVARFSVMGMLGNDNIELIEAKSGEEALEILKTNIPHLMISDIIMPGISGLELLKRVKKKSKTKSIPIIIITSDQSLETREEVFQLGAEDFVVKPFVEEDFIPRVHRYIV